MIKVIIKNMFVAYGSMKIEMGNCGEKDPGISILEFK